MRNEAPPPLETGRCLRAWRRALCAWFAVGCVVLGAAVAAAPALAQSEVDLFGGFGSAEAGVDAESPEPGTRMKEGEGALTGRVFNAETGSAIRGVTVILQYPTPVGGAAREQLVGTTDSDGAYEFPSVSPGSGFQLSFVKSGYRTSAMTGVEVFDGNLARADFPLPPLAAADAGSILDLEAFVVDEAVAGQMVQNLELRLDSDSMLNLMSAEDLSRFAASDVADALKRVAGVNIVEGQFAIIRGLEDRYSSTTFNGAPVPSPDPDRQSVQLDLFPSEIVQNIGVAKTFTPELPGNSSGGSIDIFTQGYPDELTLKGSFGLGYNTNAINRFLAYEPGNPVGKEHSGTDTIEREVGLLIGDRMEVARRELRYVGIVNYETDYKTARGYQEGHQPRLGTTFFLNPQEGGLANGLLALSDSRFDLLTSGYEERWTGYGGLGFDLDEEAQHKIDVSVFYTQVSQEIVQARERGRLEGFDYTDAIAKAKADPFNMSNTDWLDFAGNPPATPAEVRGTLGNWFIDSFRESISKADLGRGGGVWWAPYAQSQSFERNRDLLVTQINGEDIFPEANDLAVSWAANWARTKQDDLSRRLRYFYEPDDPSYAVTPDAGGNYPIDSFEFPTSPEDLGPGQWANQSRQVLSSGADVVENQGFGRVDLDYVIDDAFDDVVLEFQAGGWYEKATRKVEAFYLESPNSRQGLEAIVFADTPLELGRAAFDDLLRNRDTGLPEGTRIQQSEASRQVGALSLSGKATFFEDVDVFAGVRIESLQISTKNDPLTGELNPDGSTRLILGAPNTFPQIYIFGDRIDNIYDRRPDLPDPYIETPNRPPATTVWNDQLLNLDRKPNNFYPNGDAFVDLITEEQILDFVNQGIDDWNFLPAAGLTWRFYEGAVLRAAYSQTVARPSLREVGYYVSVEPGSDDLVLGNPLLKLSNVNSWDGRAEYTWGDFGDLVAMSGFFKTIDDPIESIVIQNPLNASGGNSAFYRTFFNNDNTARLWGIEIEARKNLGFEGFRFGEWFSLGGNFTWISAKVERSVQEVSRFDRFFIGPNPNGPGLVQLPNELVGDRRLFGQPEWIANADLSFDQEEWGTKVTLAYFGISDVLDAAGSATLNTAATTVGGVVDRYIDTFYQLDLVISQSFEIPRVAGGFTFKVSAKNLTNSPRGIVYDRAVLNEEVEERHFRVGRDFKFSIGYAW